MLNSRWEKRSDDDVDEDEEAPFFQGFREEGS